MPIDLSHSRLAARIVGCLGSALVAVGGLAAGALPAGARPDRAALGLVTVYTGLALLLLGWAWYGRLAGTVRQAYRTLALWAAPLLIAPPMFSRDVYSYLAQGVMIGAGQDVYRHGPAALGGVLAAQVPAVWQHTPSPYGPTFMVVARAVARLADDDLMAGVLAMRVVAVGGLGLLAVAVPVLARAAGIDAMAAVWLAVLNPLVLIHLIGGAHNDALMVGLLAAGLAVAVCHRPLVATVLVTAAALVKAPAALGLVAVAAIWAAQLPGRWRRVRAAGAVAAVAGSVTVVITRLAGTGYGWIGTLSTPISAQNFSITGVLGRWTAGLFAEDDVGVSLAVQAWRWAGVLAIALVAATVWIYRYHLGPIYGLGIVLVALVVFGPALRPWYLIWGLVPLAVAARHAGVRRAVTVLCAVLVPVVLPDGFAATAGQVALALLGVVLGAAVFVLFHFTVTRTSGTARPAWVVR